MNLELLNKTIQHSGMTKKAIAARMGISYTKFTQKCLGLSAWRVDEARDFSETMKLTNKQSHDIFFAREVANMGTEE